jgi:hypothetical protein
MVSSPSQPENDSESPLSGRDVLHPGLRTYSLSWTADQLNSLTPASGGNLSPELIDMGRRDSSLMAAVAIATNSVTRLGGIEELFAELRDANNEPNARTDSPKNIERRLRMVSRFKLPLLRQAPFETEVVFEPLVPPGAGSARQRMSPIANTFSALDQGSAVIFPIPRGMVRQMTGSRGPGRTFWGVVTGYQEQVSLPGIADSGVIDEPPESERPQPAQIEFTIAVPLLGLGLLTLVRDEKLDKLFGDHPRAYIVKPRRKKAASPSPSA